MSAFPRVSIARILLPVRRLVFHPVLFCLLSGLLLPGIVPGPVVAAAGGTIHVDPVAGSDANSGSAASPYRTIQQALRVVVPGETIRLASGVYQEANRTVTAGTVTSPITIEPEAGARPILDGKSNKLNAIRIVQSYYVLRNLEIRSTKQGVRLEGVTGVILEDNLIHDISNEGIRIRYFSRGNVVRNNIIYGCGLAGNGEAIYIGTAPEQRYKNSGEPDTSTNNTITGNLLYEVEEGIDVKEDASFTIVSGNIVHNTTDPNSAGISIRSDGNYVFDNRSYDNAGAGFRFGGDITDSPIHGDGYHYGVGNVLRNNRADGNSGYGYKFMAGPQDTDCSNGGAGNGKSRLHFGAGVEVFLSCP